MQLIIHRGSHQIGGSCFEFRSGGHTLFIDMDLPLDFHFDQDINDRQLAKRFEELGMVDVLERHRKNGIRWTRIHEIASKAVMLIRRVSFLS
jgi:hypothetical protein